MILKVSRHTGLWNQAATRAPVNKFTGFTHEMTLLEIQPVLHLPSVFDREKRYLFLFTPEVLYELMVAGIDTLGIYVKRSREGHRRLRMK